MASLPPSRVPPPQTPRLLLRDLVPDDAAALFEVFADPTARGLYPAMAERSHVDAWVERNLRRYAEEGFGLWALVLRETGEMVGDCGLTLQDLHGQDALEVGWHVRADLRGRGLATEAGRACLAAARTTFGSRTALATDRTELLR